jgi:hypothetical protein
MSVLFYFIGKNYYQNPEKLKALDEIHKLLNETKQIRLKKEIMTMITQNLRKSFCETNLTPERRGRINESIV